MTNLKVEPIKYHLVKNIKKRKKIETPIYNVSLKMPKSISKD
jgi:hypothetical protein